MTQPGAPKASLTARLDERFIAPVRNASFARRTWFSVTVAGIILAHGILLAALLWRDRTDPSLQAKLDETPIEVVVEPPKPEQPPAPQPPAAQPAIEKPATSAPRAPNDETADQKADDKDTHAPKAPDPAAATPPDPAEAKAEPDKAQPDPPPTPEKTEAEAKPQPPKPDEAPKAEAEALDKLTPPEPPKRPAKFAQAKPHPKTALQKLAGSSDLPDYTFAKPMKKRAKVTGGTEDDRYLAVVYGMITQQHRQIQTPDGEWSVSVSFQVDGHGQLVGVEVTQRSGYREVDMAAVEAVESAAPFPPPPSGAITGLVARLRSSTDPRPMMAGQQ